MKSHARADRGRPGPPISHLPDEREASESIGASTASLFFKRSLRSRPTPAAGLEPGRTVGDFRLVELIGEGGMGQVWRAEQRSLGGRRVAVKFVRPERVSARHAEYFAREARAGGRLSHPGIVSIHGYGEAEGLAWIAMEFVEEAWTLRDSIDEIAREPEVPGGYDREVARLVAEVADAMQAAHDEGVIHRDLKPQNILITPEDHPKVTDFGLARIEHETALSQSGDVAGTYLYMSPEQIRGSRSALDHRSDVFSLGVILYEMLGLRRPFGGDSAAQIIEQILKEEPADVRTLRPRVPKDLAVIAGKALEKDPAKRYGSMAELAADLRRFLAHEPIAAQPPTRVERLAKWARRHPVKSVAGSVATVLTLALLALLAANLRGQRALAQRGEELGRLSDLQDLEELEARADDLDEMWPPYPDRIEAILDLQGRLEELVARLPMRRATYARLLEGAVAPGAASAAAPGGDDPDATELAALRAERGWRARRLAVLEGEAEVEPEAVDFEAFPREAGPLSDYAWDRVKPNRTLFGEELRALAVADEALRLAEGAPIFGAVADTLAWAHLAAGQLDEAEALAALAEEQNEALAEGAEQLRARAEELRRADGLAAERARIAELDAETAGLEAQLEAQAVSSRELDDVESRWWARQLRQLIARLEALDDPRTGLLVAGAVSPEHGISLPDRLAIARRLEAGFAEGGDYARRWSAALPAIEEAYGGLRLEPQMGLLPLRADPRSGLWEFWHLPSGDEPRWDPELERHVLDEPSGLVLVLVQPREEEWVGSIVPSDEARAGEPFVDPERGSELAPVDDEFHHPVRLHPFFVSKYEVTQAQWARLIGTQPAEPTMRGPLHPVVQVSWHEAREACRRWGLELPTEAQWEVACRAGSTTPYPGVSSWEELQRHANLMDGHEGWSDARPGLCAVGTLLPNPFGLHDISGNAWEWCLDAYTNRFVPASPGDGSRTTPLAAPDDRSIRGGSYNTPFTNARAANRASWSRGGREHDVGFRPAREATERAVGPSKGGR